MRYIPLALKDHLEIHEQSVPYPCIKSNKLEGEHPICNIRIPSVGMVAN